MARGEVFRGDKGGAFMKPNEECVYDHDGRAIPSEDFDYEAIDRNVFGADEIENFRGMPAESIDLALKLHRVMLEWIFQDGMKNPEGIKIRAILACWIWLPYLEPLTLTELATGFGKQKQSFGRWVDDFKRHFSFITPNMRPI
jgi:hypothetical protein